MADEEEKTSSPQCFDCHAHVAADEFNEVKWNIMCHAFCPENIFAGDKSMHKSIFGKTVFECSWFSSLISMNEQNLAYCKVYVACYIVYRISMR